MGSSNGAIANSAENSGWPAVKQRRGTGHIYCSFHRNKSGVNCGAIGQGEKSGVETRTRADSRRCWERLSTFVFATIRISRSWHTPPRPVVVRHPTPYGDLTAQAVQRFATFEDCDRQRCTIEEREEYEQHINVGVAVYAGVDYARILAAAEKEADIILWDGGNNDWSFFKSDLEIVLLDPHRAGHELLYHPWRN